MHPVGYREGRTEDPTRPRWRGEGARPLAWAAWYPATAGAAAAERLADTLFTMGPVAEAAAVSRAELRWPVVLLSHGTGGTAQGMGWLGRRLAERGFVCIGVNHHGNTAVEPYLAEGFLCWWERSADLSAILDHLAADASLGPRLDLDRVAVCGFSLGGHTALASAGAIFSMARFEAWRTSGAMPLDGPREFPDLVGQVAALEAGSAAFRESLARHGDDYRDPRVRAVLALAPAPTVRGFEPESLARIEAPARILAGEADTEAPHDLCALWLAERNPRFRIELLGPEVGHYVFVGEPTEEGRRLEPAICLDAPGVDRRAIQERTAETAAGFFHEALA